jgi:hypothetical protein
MPDNTSKNNPRDQPIDFAISSVNKHFGGRSLMRMGDAKRMNVSAISIGSVSLDLPFGGRRFAPWQDLRNFWSGIIR